MIKATIIFLFFTIPVLSQSEKDTKEFLIDVFEANYEEVYEPSYLLFSNSIFKIDAEGICGRKMTDTEFDNILIYAFELQVGTTESEIIGFSESIDIRDMRKVSAIKQEDDNYMVLIYLKGNYPSSRTVTNSRTKNKRTINNLDKLKMALGTNKDAAIKIKRALIHLGKLKGVDVQDGDMF